MPTGPVDPSGIGAAAGRLSNGPRRRGRTSILIASALLEEGERVTYLVQGQLEGAQATLVLTDRRLMLVNDREWQPKVVPLELSSDLTVQGLQDGKNASLQLQSPGQVLSVERIADVALAQDMAGAIRARAAATSPNGPPGA